MATSNQLYYIPYVSVYDFFKSFFVALSNCSKEQESKIIKGDIVKHLHNAKRSGKYDDVLDEFDFIDNGLFVASKQVEDGLYQMHFSGLIAREKRGCMCLVLHINSNIENEIREQIDVAVMCKVEQLVKEFVV